MALIYLVLSVFIGTTVAQLSTDNLSFNDPITLPPELQQKFNESDVNKIKSQLLTKFEDKCKQNGHPELFEQAEKAAANLMTCFSSLVNMEALQQEIEDAKPTGQVDEVFKKYCYKTPDFKNCFRNMTETVKPCFSSEEQKNFKVLYNVTEQLADFICFKDGDRIALFIAEGGQECFQEKQEDIQNCFNSTFDAETQGNLQNMTVDGFMELEFKEKQCNQMTTLQTCIVSVLEKCTKPTSANIVDSLFNFIRKATPCKKFSVTKATGKTDSGQDRDSTAPGAATTSAITSATLVIALVAKILV